jgi:hypothetical protein
MRVRKSLRSSSHGRREEKPFKSLPVYYKNRRGDGGVGREGACENKIRNISRKLIMEAYIICSQVDDKN